MSTSTTNYDFTLPAVADPIDEDLWGAELNSNWSSLDDILPTPAANKYGAIAVQNNADNGLDYITSQGSVNDILVSAGADALPAFSSVASLKAVINDITWPVGSVYENFSDPTNPATLLGVGTWVAITDVFLVARGGTYSGTGGAATVSLSEANLAPHAHPYSRAGGASLNGGSVFPIFDGSGNAFASSTGVSGSGTPFSIIPPYQAVYTWKRTV